MEQICAHGRFFCFKIKVVPREVSNSPPFVQDFSCMKGGEFFVVTLAQQKQFATIVL